MKLAVLPVFCNDVPRVTTLTRDWLHRAIGHVAGFFFDQSGGREDFEFRVFDWVQLPLTSAEWNGLGFEVGHTAKAKVIDALGVDLSPFDHFAFIIDKADAQLAAVSPSTPTHVLVGAQDCDPALLEHEFGHFFGANHANLAGPDGMIEYGDNYCIMGGEGSKFSRDEPALYFQDANGNQVTGFAQTGPGMAAPALLACGWLNLGEHGVDIGPRLCAHPWETTVELAPLRGAPPPGQAGVPVCAFADGVAPDRRVLVQYRSRDGWDAAMPQPPAPANGWVEVHLSTGSGGGTTSLQVAVLPASAGATAFVGDGAFRVTVAGVDAIRNTVILRVGRETWRPWFVPRPEHVFNRLAPVAAVAREPEHMDVFKVGLDGAVWSSWWHGDGQGWRPWFQIFPQTVFAQHAPITAIARRRDHIDLFTTGFDGAIWSAWWHDDATGWRPWFQIFPQTVFSQDRRTEAVAREPEHMDLFRIGFDGALWSAWWHGDNVGWRPWFQIFPQTRFALNADVTAVAREPNHLDVFVVGNDGGVWSCWWHGDNVGWRPFFRVPGHGGFDPGQRVAAVARRPDHLDLFCVDRQGIVWSAWWHADATGWRPWFPLFPERRFPNTARVSAVAREPEHVDVFVTADNGVVWSAWWHGDNAGWRPWFPIQPATVFDHRLAVTALARRPDHMDLFQVGFDGRIWSTFWHPV